MVKLMLQIAAEMLNRVVRSQRDNEHSDKCFYPVAQHKLNVSMVKPVLRSTAKVTMMKLALHMTTEAIMWTQMLRSTVKVSR